jgi:hypothetical protein
VFLAVLVVVLTMPVESVLLRALAAPDQATAAQQFVSGLGPSDLSIAAGQVQAYPFVYRRAIMRSLPPQLRAIVWRGHVEAYIQMHPELDQNAVELLQYASSLITPDLVSGQSSGSAEIGAVATQIQATLGRDVADYLMYRLGPKDGPIAATAVASVLPIRERLANFVRREFVVLAFGDDCDCATDWGCDSGSCDGSSGCSPDNSWPMCGWLWSETCNGTCRNGIAKQM